nr:MAG TPA: hypothetical protein [Caudoviricetes sp.]
MIFPVFVSFSPVFRKFSTKFSTCNPPFRGQKVAKNTSASRACVLIDFLWFISRRVGGIFSLFYSFLSLVLSFFSFFSLSGGRELFWEKPFCLQMVHKKDLAGS